MESMLVNLLRSSGADAWELNNTITRGWEFYFIGHRLDQHRVRSTQHFRITVYHTADGKMGKASGEIPPTATKESAGKLIHQLLQNASVIENPVYRLNTPQPASALPVSAPHLSHVVEDFLQTMKSLPETDTENINSYELFVDEDQIHFLNSSGIDLKTSQVHSALEVVVNARNERQEIELYRNYSSGSCDSAFLRDNLSETFRFARDRLLAVPTPRLGSSTVLFSGTDALAIYEWFISNMNAAYKYQGYSRWEIGSPISADLSGDPVTLSTLQTLPNSSSNCLFDEEGAPVRDLVLIRNNVPEHFHGTRQYCQYLGIDHSFIAKNFSVSGGTLSRTQLITEPALEVVEFSDFQVNPITGDIAGEIRLGYYHNNGSVIPVTGGSVSGSMYEFLHTMRFSSETRQYNNMLIPAMTRLEQVHVTGCG